MAEDIPKGGETELDALHAALGDCLRALRRRQAPNLDLHALSQEDRRLMDDFAALAQTILARKRSLTLGIDALADGFAIFDTEGRLMHANRSFRNFFSVAIRPDRGVSLREMLLAVARRGMIDMGDEPLDIWLERVSGHQNDNHVVTLRDGRTLYCKMRLNPMGHLVALVADISDDVQREREMEIARQQAEDAAAAKTSFLAQMSHEFRTPMNGVIGMAELLCDSGLTGQHQRYAETIRNSAEALLGLINDVLDYARGQARPAVPLTQRFDLERLCCEVVTLLMMQAAEKGLDLRMIYDPLTPAVVAGDPGRFRQILMNLLGNALKYTARGFVHLHVVRTHDGIAITVRDSGPGIPGDKIDMIFDEFSRLDAQAAPGMASTGLGLAITRQLVDSLGGRLWVQSYPGEGSCFGVLLPAAMTLAAGPSVRNVPVDPPFGPLLLVQSNPGARRRLKRILACNGLRLHTAHDGDEAAARIGGGLQPAAILINAGSDIEGADALRARLAALLPEARFLILVPATQDLTGAERFDGAIRLPLPRATVIGTINQAMQRRAAPGGAAGDDQPRMKVLIVDDNATNRLVLQKMLRLCEVEISSAEDGQAAVELWQRDGHDLILMDISMPVLDGRGATAVIRRQEEELSLPRTAIVAVTAHVADEDADMLIAADMDDVMTKPVRRQTLLAMLERFAPADVLRPMPISGPVQVMPPGR